MIWGIRCRFQACRIPYGGYSTYQGYLEANALVISSAADLAKLANITPAIATDFSFSSAKGSISKAGDKPDYFGHRLSR